MVVHRPTTGLKPGVGGRVCPVFNQSHLLWPRMDMCVWSPDRVCNEAQKHDMGPRVLGLSVQSGDRGAGPC